VVEAGMKTISGALATHLAGELTTLATCWRVTRRDGAIFGFTDAVGNLNIDGVLFEADAGYTPTTVATSSNLAVDNLDVEGLLDSEHITEVDIQAGLWDHAEVEIFQVNYLDLTQGKLWLRKGRLGEVRIGRSSFVAELRGLAQALQATIGELYSVTCRADLGDGRCQVNLASFTVTGTVTAVSSRRVFTDSGRGEAAGWFAFGKLTWTSGNNDGFEMEVKAFSGGVFTLVLPMPYDIQIGDGYSVYAGCDKLFSTCKTKFNNVVNFRGEPHLPGVDAILRGPK
jgi:uncharacterized phage protein (TIGR02218 family)